MEQYISKAAILAEIEKKKKLLPWGSCASQISMECNCKNEAYDDVISLLDTLEVKEVLQEPVSKDFRKGYIQAIEDACKWLQEHCTYTHPRKGCEECVVNIPRFKNDLLK